MCPSGISMTTWMISPEIMALYNMSNTSGSPPHSRPENTLLTVILLLCCSLQLVASKETVILDALTTTNDRILYHILHETHDMLKCDRKVGGEDMTCLTLLKNQLTTNSKVNITKIRANLDYGKWALIANKQLPSGIEVEQIPLIKRIDSILDIMKGECLHYLTSTFIYQFCHKEHVRQFDSEYTKFNNQKKAYEDIYMGYFNKLDHDAWAVKHKKTPPPPVVGPNNEGKLPEISNFESKYGIKTVDDLVGETTVLAVDDSTDGQLFFGTVLLVQSDHFVNYKPSFVQLHCEGYQLPNYALIVGAYEMLYTRRNHNCTDKVHIESLATPQAIYYDDNSSHPLRVYGKYLYGDVEERCTADQVWQKDKYSTVPEPKINPGSTLQIELYNNQTGNYQVYLTSVKKVVHSELIELSYPLGMSIYHPTAPVYMNQKLTGEVAVGNITRCQVLFQKTVDFELKTQRSAQFLRHDVVRFDEPVPEDKVQEPLGCLCKSKNGTQVKHLDLLVRLGKEIFPRTYKTQVESKSKVLEWEHIKESVLTGCQEVNCFPFEQQKEQEKIKIKYTEIVRMNKDSSHLQVNQQAHQNVYIVRVKRSGLVKLHTIDSKGNRFVYLLTSGQIIKIQKHKNGTKQIIKQNKHYENLTSPSKQLTKNQIYVKVGVLSNGTKVGGIWKANDRTQFPRFFLIDETIVSFERVAGFADVRIIDPFKLKDPRSIAVMNFIQLIQDAYSSGSWAQFDGTPYKDPENTEPKPTFLENSYSINYTYTSGEYCAQPINKYRQTIVTIKCGDAYFDITQLKETSPCEYWIEVQTSLLCKEGTKKVVTMDQDIPSKGRDDSVIFSGVLCHTHNIFDQASPFVHLESILERRRRELGDDMVEYIRNTLQARSAQMQ